MREWLEEARGKRYVGVAELAQEAARILAESGTAQQARGTVTELPDERTVRYYLTEGLVAPAEEKQGTASVFGYVHLLQLLVVKKLQSERLPIRMIRELVGSSSERKLERLLGSEQDRRATKAGDKNDALRYLETLLTKAHSAPMPPRASGPMSTRPSPPAPSPPAAAQSAQAKWERVEIEPGLELHIRGNYGMPQESRGVRRLVQSILRTIEAYGGRPGKRGS